MADDEIEVQFFWPVSGGYSERASLRLRARLAEWHHLEFRIPDGFSNGRIRLDPGDREALIEISEMFVSAPGSQAPLWSLDPCSGSDVEVGGTSVRIPCQTALRIFSYGSDPSIVLPEFERISAGTCVRLSIRVRTELRVVAEIIQEMADDIQLERLMADLLRCDLNALISEQSAGSELARVCEERDRALERCDALLKSWSWRLSFPLRLVGGVVRQTSGNKQ